MPRRRTTPPTASSVRGLATKRGLPADEGEAAAASLQIDQSCGRAAPMLSKDKKDRYSWKLADADASLRKQPLLRDQ
jgi:hypothetical protein